MTMGLEPQEIRFDADGAEVSGLVVRPDGARWLYLFGHGAGAGMRHRFMAAMTEVLVRRGVATFRYQFPYMERGGRRPDARPTLLTTVRAAAREAARIVPGLPVIAGGKSMGGRMTSLAMAEAPIDRVVGLAFLGFPLHAAGKQPSAERGAHLAAVPVPMLFLQGTRDTVADLTLLEPLTRSLGERATLHVVEGADHSFHVLKRSGRQDEDVLEELGDSMAAWARDHVGIAE
ncbi:MAG TPA: alpha/beta family hydrolase [Gemmatimonadales bacterium]|nr:alpha/beta family hydrolase [Gemmatimonadales bacterium]